MNSDNQNISVIDFNKICRICMSEGDLVNIFNHCEGEDYVFEMLACCTLVMVSVKDELPDKICLQCLNELKVSYKFYQKCEVSDIRLHIVLEKSKQTHRVANSPSMSSKIQLERMQTAMKNNLEISTIEKDASVSLESDTAYKNIHNDHDYIITENITEKENSTPDESVFNCNQINTDTDQTTNSSKTSNSSTYECTKCSKIGFTYRQLRIHWMTVHGVKCAERKCEVCKKLIVVKEFKQHIQSHPYYKAFACDVCDAKFKSEANLLTHKVSHLSVKPYLCDKCDTQFSRLGSLQKHIKKQSCPKVLPPKKISRTPDGYQCRVCNRCYPSKAGLYQHALIHGNKKYLCWYCGKNFTTCGSLLSHVKTHTGIKSYQCSYCPKSFSHSSGLKIHTFTHTGEKRYTCEFCSKSFAQLPHLKYHVRMHTGEMPYKCSQCDKRFVTNNRLKIHTRTHTGETPHVCEVCGKGFHDPSYMRRHMKIHARPQKDLN